MVTKYLGITGPKKSGKTTTIETIIPKLIEKGYKVGTVKIAFKDVSIDVNKEHYDVVRLRQKKPHKTLFKSKIETVIFVNEEKTLRQALKEFGLGLDFVLLEGFKEDLVGFPQIVLLKEKDQEKEFTDDFTARISSIPEFSIVSKDPRFVAFEKINEIIEQVALPLFPKLDCEHCGYKTCLDLTKDVIAGKKTVNDCYIVATEDSNLVLSVNDKVVPCNPFVQDIIRNVLLGFLKTLKVEEQGIKDVEIKMSFSQAEGDISNE
ncbi:MAG: molybdopterin-guanine dinucleotide biosynthesis protein B [Candidatus Heimdallarchaeota archaeon]